VKTTTESITFTKADVLRYCEAIGEKDKLYENEQYALAQGLQTIPLPPTMPLVMYQLFEIPWNQMGLTIHRKQECFTIQRMFIEEQYTGYILLSDVVTRKSYTFRKETLYINDKSGDLCFKGTSHIVVSDAP
jgi:hypothetical protein